MCTVRSSGLRGRGHVAQHELWVGVYPSMHWAWAIYPSMHWAGGVYPSMHWPGGVCIPACTGQGVVSAGGVCPGGVCQMVSAWRCLPQCMLGYTPPPVNRMTDTQVYKHYLSANSFVDGKYFCMLVNIFGEIFQRLFVSLNPRVIVSNFETNFFTDLY